MACFKRLKFWNRASNCKSGVLRSVLKSLLPCIKQRSRILSPESSRTHEEETSCRRKLTRDLCLKDFKIIGGLGAGSFGQVVLAKKKSTGGHSSSEEVFALKLVPNKLVSKVEKEFLVRAVGHPFLVQLLTYFQTKESFCDVIQYCKGGTVHSLMSRLKQFHEDLARFYAAEIILAVNFLHKCGIIHRDIKLGNILLDRDGQCKLADFGLSQAGMFKWIQKASVCGTEAYMAPEIHQGCLYGPEVDWWSVGCVMFDTMLGKCVQKILSFLNDIRCN
jgi:serine/threonine protein kinase